MRNNLGSCCSPHGTAYSDPTATSCSTRELYKRKIYPTICIYMKWNWMKLNKCSPWHGWLWWTGVQVKGKNSSPLACVAFLAFLAFLASIESLLQVLRGWPQEKPKIATLWAPQCVTCLLEWHIGIGRPLYMWYIFKQVPWHRQCLVEWTSQTSRNQQEKLYSNKTNK